MPNHRHCTACGIKLSGDEPGGLCPKCLLLAAVGGPSGSHLHVRCPQCQIAIEIVDDPSVREVTCPSCDSRFSLIGEMATTAIADRGGRVGRFELIERVGLGAFGSVWKARDPELDRQVAVKLPRKEQLSPDEAEQFLREAQAAGQLRHPGIVAVHEVGRDGDRIYIVSDFIQGVTLADSMSARRPAARDAVLLCRQVALALQHAHQQGVIHRDLKPSNIILDDAGQPHVMDFGLAKREAAEITMTVEGRILGTPAYMSPEQARGDAHQADARSDVYSLGVILFELLTGEKPFRGTSQMLLYQVLQEEAPSPRQLNAAIPRELETICLKCLEKEPDRRYQTAGELADELQRFLDDVPIRARPISRWQRFGRWCRRYPVVSGLAAAVVASLLLGLATTFWQWRIAQSNFDDANTSRQKALDSQQETQTALDESESRLARVYVERGLQKIDVNPHAGLPWLIRALETEPADSPTREMHRLRIGLMLRELPALVGYWPKGVDATFSEDGSRVAVASGREALVFQLPEMRPVTPMQHDQPVVSIRFTRQGDRLATVSFAEGSAPRARIWSAATGLPETESLDLSEREYNLRDVPKLHFTPAGDRFVALYAGMYNRWHSKMVTRVFDSRTLQQVSKTFAHHCDLDFTDGYHQLSPDATRVLVPRGVPADHAGVAWVDPEFPKEMNRPQQYDLMTAKPVHPPLDHPLDFYGLPVYSADGLRIATADDRAVKVWNAANGSLVKEFSLSPGETHARVQFHPDGASIFVIEGRHATWYDLATGDAKQKWTHEGKFLLDPTGQHIVLRDPNGQDYLYDLGAENVRERGLPDLYSVRFCPDGSRLVLNPGGRVEAGVWVSPPQRIFRVADAEPLTPPWRFADSSISQPFSHTGRHFLTKFDIGVWLWDLDRCERLVEEFPAGRTSNVVDAAVTPDQKTLAVLTKDLSISCWDAETGQPRYAPFQIPRPTPTDSESKWQRLTLNAAGNVVALLGEFHVPPTGKDRREVHVVQLWDLQTGQLLCDPIPFDEEPKSWIEGVRFLRDDQQLLVTEYLYRRGREPPQSATKDVTRLHLFNAATGAALRPPQDFPQTFRVLDFTPGNKQCLVYREEDSETGKSENAGTPRAWLQMFETAAWQPATSRMTSNDAYAWNARLSPDGTRIVMGGAEVWDSVSGKCLIPALVPHRSVGEIVFQRDGQGFLAITDEGVTNWNRSSEIRRYDLAGNSLFAPLVDPRIGTSHCAVHPQNSIIAAAGHGLRFWDARQGTALTSAIDIQGGYDSGRVENHNRTTFFTPSGNRLYIEARSHLYLVRWDELKAAVPSDTILTAWSGILSGERIDPTGGVIPLTADDYQHAWETLQKARTEPDSAK